MACAKLPTAISGTISRAPLAALAMTPDSAGALRSVVMTAFVFVPVSETGVIVFCCLLGLVWLATVPLTTAVVAQIFGPAYVATLYGISFFTHQLGSFLGIWLGGYLYDVTGSYDAIWWVAVALGLVASLMHFPIDDRPIARVAPTAA